MNRLTQLLLIVSIAAAGCNREEPKTRTEQVGAATPSTGDTVATRGSRDSDFLREQIAVEEKQVGLGALASERATHPAVKKFAETLSRDHQQASEELRRIASGQRVSVAAEGEELKVERERLSRISGEQFEEEYLDEIIADHEDAVGDLENAAKRNDLEVSQWAAKTLPIVRRHLEEARQLRTSLPQRGNAPR
jgi:putative membrane protein